MRGFLWVRPGADLTAQRMPGMVDGQASRHGSSSFCIPSARTLLSDHATGSPVVSFHSKEMTMLKKLMTMAAMALLMGSVACTAEVEDEGKAPSVEVKGGEMPEVDVDPANVEVSTDTQQVVTPEVNVTPAQGNP
jgi:hypothetical protein